MKKIFLSLMLLLPMLFVGCKQEEIVFEHEKPQFELKENAILLEVIVPAGTSAKDQIYMIGAFNGQDTLNYVNADFCLQKAEKVDSKYGIYLYPEDFKEGKSLSDGFLFVSKLQGIENPATPHILDNCVVGQRYQISIVAWGGAAQQPEIEHDGYAVFVLDETGWDALTLYMWGDVDGLNGEWPGMAVTGTQTIEGVTYQYFDMGAANTGLAENLIFNNNGGGTQLADFAYTINRDIYLRLTADGVEEISNEPEIEHDGFVVFVLDSTGWDALTLYMWGDVNGLNGEWPGMQVTGTQTIKGVEYKYFDMGAANTGLAENLIFNNNGSTQLKDFAYTIDHDTILVVTANGVRGLDADPIPTPEPADTIACTLYVEDATGWDCLSVYGWENVSQFKPFGEWPGATVAAKDIENTIVKDGVTYHIINVVGPDGYSINLIFNNNACADTDDDKLQYNAPAITLSQGAEFYLRADADQATLVN